jgi:non-ribosomal peptide synthetase component F
LRITPYAVLFACFVAVLWRRSGQSDITVPTLFNGRTEAAMNEMIGYFDNILLFRHMVDAGSTVGEFLRSVGREVVEDQEHYDVPLLRVMNAEPRLVMLLQDPRNIWPVFHYDVDQRSLRHGGTGASTLLADRVSPAVAVPADDDEEDDEAVYSFGVDIDFTARDTAGGFYLRALYNHDIFEPATIRGLLRDYADALRRAVAPDGLEQSVSWLVPEDGE